MRTSMSLEEFAELVQMRPAELDEVVALELLDPAGEGRFGDLDLVRLMAIRHYEALGYDAKRLAAEIKAGQLEPFLDYVRDFPAGHKMTPRVGAQAPSTGRTRARPAGRGSYTRMVSDWHAARPQKARPAGPAKAGASGTSGRA
jgi:hypothetical protein